jgi:hypothetical protein
MRSRELQVSASADDAEEFANDGSVVLDSPELELGTDAVARVVGVRFRDVGIPPGADILSAHVQFTASASDLVVVSFAIVGEAADDAAAFSAITNDLSARDVTMNSVTWPPGGWNAEASGDDQLTPDLEPILQEIVDRPLWSDGNAIVLLFSTSAGAGIRRAYSYDGRPLSAPQLVVEYEEPSTPMVGPQDLPICVLPASNPNIGGSAPSGAELMADCQGRVEDSLSGLAGACGYPSECNCELQSGSQRFSEACDSACVENIVDMDCSDFDPVASFVDATNAMGDQPVCVANSALASAIYGRRTACTVAGLAHVEIEGEGADPPAAGVLYFRGDPCAGESCPVGMEYRLDIGDVTFGNIFGSETFQDLAGLGESVPGQDAVLSPSGGGTFGVEACLLSARGRRGSEARALATSNDDVINVNVGWGSMAPTCVLSGALVGSADPELKRCENAGPDANKICADDSECTDHPDCSDGDCNCLQVGSADLILSLNVAGGITNQPPTANAGDDQTVECPALAVLDATGSSDLDSNIALFSWRRGGRTGEEVGFEEMSEVQQGLGTETYVLRVIDALAQADEDATAVTVVDTTPPELSCSVAMPVLRKINHNFHNVGLSARARDACEGELPVMASVFADEDDEAQTGDGHFSPDGKNIAVGSLSLRGERQGNGDGRVYLILVEATDSSGNRGVNCCTVIVPHSATQGALQSAQAQADAAEAFCLANEGTAPGGYFTIGDGPVIGPKQ